VNGSNRSSVRVAVPVRAERELGDGRLGPPAKRRQRALVDPEALDPSDPGRRCREAGRPDEQSLRGSQAWPNEQEHRHETRMSKTRMRH
jgi:hypothetical protein